MALDQTANFVRGGVSSSVGSTDTTISVADASIFPDPSNGNYNLVIWDAGSYARPDLDPDVEIIRVTGRDTTADDLTVERGKENTTGVSHPSASELQLAPTAKMFDDIGQETTSEVVDLSADGSTTIFTLPHNHGRIPSGVAVTPETQIAAADDFWIDEKRDTEVDLKYPSAPSSGTASWNLSLNGDGSPAIPDSGISRWEFEQDLTDSWDGYDGTANGDPQFTTTAEVGSYARDYDGASDYDDWGDITESEGTTAFSVSMWIRPAATGTTFRFISGKSEDSVWRSTLNDSGNIRFAFRDDGSDFSNAVGSTLSSSTWYHIVGVFDSGSITLYLNGSSDATASTSNNTLNTTTTNVTTGGPNYGGFDYYDGIIDDVRLYDKALTSTEVSNLYNSDSI